MEDRFQLAQIHLPGLTPLASEADFEERQNDFIMQAKIADGMCHLYGRYPQCALPLDNGGQCC